MNYTLSENDRQIIQQLLSGLRRGGFNFTPMGVSLPQQPNRTDSFATAPLIWRLMRVTGTTSPTTLGARKYWAATYRRTVNAIDDTSAAQSYSSAFEIADATTLLINLGDHPTDDTKAANERRLSADDWVVGFSFGELSPTGQYPIYYTNHAWLAEIQYSTAIHNLQVAFTAKTGATFYNRVQFDPCNTTPSFTRIGAGGFTGASRVLRELVSVSGAGEGGSDLITARRRFTGRANGNGRYELL